MRTSIRQVIKARDIQNFFGKKERQSFKMMSEMRKHFAKKAFQPITIGDFCEYYNVKAEELSQAMQATDEFENKNAAKRKTKKNPFQENQQSPSNIPINNCHNPKPQNTNSYTFSKKSF